MLFFIPIALYSQSFEGKVIRVIEGDVLLFQTTDSTFTVRLYGVDAPDIGQIFSTETIKYLEDYLWADARITMKKNFNQDGINVTLSIRDKNINKELVKNGYAWYDRIHCVDADLARSEEQARDKKLGLWINKNPVPPWEFRQGILAKPPPVDGEHKVLICTNNSDNRYHKDYCRVLTLCRDNVIVILKEQAKQLHMKPCKYCF